MQDTAQPCAQHSASAGRQEGEGKVAEYADDQEGREQDRQLRQQGLAGCHELRHEGHEKGQALGVQRSDEKRLGSAEPNIRARGLQIAQLAGLAPHLDAQVQQIGRPEPLQYLEQLGGSHQECADPGER